MAHPRFTKTPHPKMAQKDLRSPEKLMQDAFKFEKENKIPEAVACCKLILNKIKGGDTAESAGLLWVKLSPTDVVGWSTLGLVMVNNNKTDDSEKVLSIAERIDPTHLETYINRAILQKYKGLLSDALKSYNYVLSIEPDHKRARSNRINVLLDMGLWEESKIDVDWLITQPKPSAANLALIGRYYRTVNDIEKACTYFQRAHDADPANVNIMINLSGCKAILEKDESKLGKIWQGVINAIDASPNKRLYTIDRKQMAFMLAIEKKDLFHETDMILKAENLDHVTSSRDGITVTPIDNYRCLYEFKNYYTHTEEWSIYNESNIFVNMMVVGGKKHASFHDKGYVYVHDFEFPQIRLQGPHILLGGAENYYHWWIDFLPRIGILQEFPELKNLPIIVLDRLNDNQLASLEKVGIDLNRLVKVPIGHTLMCDHLIVPSLTGRPMAENGLPIWMKPMTNDWSVNWVREKFADWRQPIAGDPKRIFISRIGTKFRRCTNEEEVYAIAQRYGFTTLKNEGMDYARQMALYGGAEMIMGPHGAGFTNLLFAPENATAIEIFPKHRAPPFYRELCGQLGQRYIKFDGPITQLPPEMVPDFGDFYVDPQEVERVLAAL